MSESDPPKDIKDALQALMLNGGSRPKAKYDFWGTQPVAQFDEDPSIEDVCFYLNTFYKPYSVHSHITIL